MATLPSHTPRADAEHYIRSKAYRHNLCVAFESPLNRDVEIVHIIDRGQFEITSLELLANDTDCIRNLIDSRFNAAAQVAA